MLLNRVVICLVQENGPSDADELGINDRFEDVTMFLFQGLGFTSKRNAWAGPDHWKYQKSKGRYQQEVNNTDITGICNLSLIFISLLFNLVLFLLFQRILLLQKVDRHSIPRNKRRNSRQKLTLISQNLQMKKCLIFLLPREIPSLFFYHQIDPHVATSFQKIVIINQRILSSCFFFLMYW